MRWTIVVAALAVGGRFGIAEDVVLFEDAAGNGSATVSQVLPEAKGPQLQTFQQVERVRLVQDVFVINWGKTAVTILPRQFVGSVTINRRAAAATQP